MFVLYIIPTLILKYDTAYSNTNILHVLWQYMYDYEKSIMWYLYMYYYIK